MAQADDRDERMLRETSGALEDAAARIAEAATVCRPGALLSALLDELEAVAGVTRATVWAEAPCGDGLSAGPAPWMQLRSRGATTPNPDAADRGHIVLRGEGLGALVFEREPFDDGAREAREDAAEALFLCADLIAAVDPGAGAAPETPTPFPMGGAGDRAA